MNKWLAATADRDALLSRYTTKHPEVESKSRVVELYRTQLNAALNRARTTAASNLELYRNQAASLRLKKAEQSKLGSDLELKIVERRTHLNALERNRDACDTAYRGILNRIQEAKLAADENTAIIKCVEPAQVPEKPVKPRALVILSLALMAGLAGGFALSLATDKLEDRIGGLQDVDGGWGLSILGAIPRVTVADRRDLVMTTLKDPNSQVAEAIAGLRAMLDSAQYRDKSWVTLLVSSQPEEGKTTTACNLAGSFAGNGQRTLIVDFDLRRPRLAGIFPMPPGQIGLLEFIAHSDEAISFESLVYDSGYPNLSVMASKPIRHAAPAHAVGDARVKALVAWARGKYDRVILDAPPLGVVSDSLVLGGLADCVLLMIRQDFSRRRLVGHALERLREAGIGNIAAVLNDVDFSRSGYGSPYYHYSKHYEAYRTPEDVPANPDTAGGRASPTPAPARTPAASRNSTTGGQGILSNAKTDAAKAKEEIPITVLDGNSPE
jgi:capsular exopolysaccharide synthesis family protein